MSRAPRIASCVVALVALVALCAGLHAGTPARAGEAPASPLAGVTLEDPDGRVWKLDELTRVPALVVVADRAASGAAVDWGRALGAARPRSVALWAAPGKVAVVSIADLRGVPSFARGMARWAIAAMVDESEGDAGPPLLLDWEGTVATRVDARAGTPNLRLYAADGSLVLREDGDATPEKVARLAAAIDSIVARPSSAPSSSPSPAAPATTEGEVR